MESSSENRLIEQVRSCLASQGDVAFGYLFGSRAKGRERPKSDVDVAIHFGKDRRAPHVPRGQTVSDARLRRARRALEVEGDLERSVGRSTQVVALEDAPLGLVQNVLATGHLVFCADHRARRAHYVDHARRYFDLEPARRIFDRYRSRRIEEGTYGGGARDRS